MPERALGRALEADVDREPHCVPGARLPLRLEQALRSAERVDANLRLARLTAEVLVDFASTPAFPTLSPER